MPPLLFSIHPGDDRPLYRQIAEQVKAAIAAGRLGAGEQLPAHRELARELVIAPLTVKKAYDLLEDEGLISQARGRGTFVLGRREGASAGAQCELLARVEAFLRQARILGLSAGEVHELIARRWSGRAARTGGTHGRPRKTRR